MPLHAPRPLLLSLGVLAGRGVFPALAMASCAIQAQTATGGLFCTVLDRQDNKPIRCARVALESAALLQPRHYATDPKGEIRAVLLPVGTYKVTITQPGYQSVLISDLRIGVGSNLSRTLEMALLPGVDRARAQAGELAGGGVITIAATREAEGEFTKADGGAPEVRLGDISYNRVDLNLEPIRANLRRKVEILASAGLLRGASSECVLVLSLSAAGAVTSLKLTGAPTKTQDALSARINAWTFGPLEAPVTLRVPVLLGR